ncbi:hypothetical protein [Corynebacterium pseudopelargi]|uniref:Uncharacterized protein n=1 Tax=Corynebacterium pseudopelargi TaxID=2080757 RepID=A0A3G6IWV5_9CORY|nr:hypothetical protein [Corynebacterium pseudopelargi]AZA10269.1 hypothetical protein CPPEL_10890 [Corynebacterium pseudopelargi]
MAAPKEHPENDLSSDADYANRHRPAPRNFDELADAPDPFIEAQRNRRSTKQAIAFVLFIPGLTMLVALLLAIVARAMGGPLCESGHATWICSREAEIWWPIASSIVPVGGIVACGVILWRKYLGYIRWRPWMGAFWATALWAMFWMLVTFQMLIVGH